MVEQGNILSGEVYFNEKLEKTNCENWHKKALETLRNSRTYFL